MLNFRILCMHVISFFATVLLPSLTKIGGNPIIKVGPTIFLGACILSFCDSGSSGSLAKFEVIQLKVGRRRFPTLLE